MPEIGRKTDPPAVVRILLVDDHGFIREGIKALIGVQPDMEVVGEAETGVAAVRQAKELMPDIVVMDISMPEMNGAQATRAIRAACPSVKVLALSMHEDGAYLRGLMEAGATGYVLKRSAPHDLIHALRYVATGNAYIDPAVAAKVMTSYVNNSLPRGEVARAPLSEREGNVIRLVARGHTNREIAERLNLSVKTVESYRARAMDKLYLTSRADLVRHADAYGWLGDQ